LRGRGPWLNRVVERHRVAVPTARRQSPPGSGWAGGNFGRRRAVEVSCTRGRRQWAAAEPRGSTPSVTAVPTAVRGASKELRSPAGLNRLRQALRRRRLLLHGSTARAGAYLPIESGRRLARSTSSAALPCRAGRRSLMTRMATASVFRTWADTDAREPVFEEPQNRGWGWEFETRERLADASSGQRQIYADGAGPCRPVKFIPSLSTAFSDQAREPFQIQYQSDLTPPPLLLEAPTRFLPRPPTQQKYSQVGYVIP